MLSFYGETMLKVSEPASFLGQRFKGINVERMKGKTIKTMLTNFVIWLIPTALFLALSVGVLAIMLMAASEIGTSSKKKDPFEKWPKGFIGSLGIGFLIVAMASLGSFFYFESIDVQGVVFICGLAILCSLFGYWGVKYDYKRLSNKFLANGSI